MKKIFSFGARETGAEGEKQVVRYLKRHGYSVLETNFHSRFGEIDIIAENGEYLCFVEVKTRSEGSFGTPAEAVGFTKQTKILRTAEYWLMQNETELQPRFDVAEVFVGKNGKPEKINFIESAFDAD